MSLAAGALSGGGVCGGPLSVVLGGPASGAACARLENAASAIRRFLDESFPSYRPLADYVTEADHA